MPQRETMLVPPVPFAPQLLSRLGDLDRAVQSAIRGKPEVVRLSLVCLLARGHLLIEDVPGVGKTTLAQSLARAVACGFHRLQFTSDMLPSDVLGVGRFLGPAFARPSGSLPAATPCRFSQCWPDTTTRAAPPGWFPSAPITRSHRPVCGSRRATSDNPLRRAPTAPVPAIPPVPRWEPGGAARWAVSCLHPLQQLAKPGRQRIAQDLFNRAVRPARLIVLTAARGGPQ